MMKKQLLVITAILLSGCSDNSTDKPSTALGSDLDANGCKASAGYAWCTKTQQCERPWELAKSNDFQNTDAAFAQFCENTSE